MKLKDKEEMFTFKLFSDVSIESYPFPFTIIGWDSYLSKFITVVIMFSVENQECKHTCLLVYEER